MIYISIIWSIENIKVFVKDWFTKIFLVVVRESTIIGSLSSFIKYMSAELCDMNIQSLICSQTLLISVRNSLLKSLKHRFSFICMKLCLSLLGFIGLNLFQVLCNLKKKSNHCFFLLLLKFVLLLSRFYISVFEL